MDLKSKLTRFGEQIDGDHAITERDGWGKALDGSKVGLCLHDLYSEYTDLYGKKSKNADDCYEAMSVLCRWGLGKYILLRPKRRACKGSSLAWMESFEGASRNASYEPCRRTTNTEGL